jgi:hypothetical protein
MIKKLFKFREWFVHFIFRIGSFWMGIHYSKKNQSYCIAVLPCVVVRIGKTDYSPDPGVFEKE